MRFILNFNFLLEGKLLMYVFYFVNINIDYSEFLFLILCIDLEIKIYQLKVLLFFVF